MIWENTDEYIKGLYKINGNYLNRTKVSAFDLDDTLITPTENKKFSVTSSDWEFYDNSHNIDIIKTKLLSLYNDDYIIVIFTNQKGIGSGKLNINIWMEKISNMCNKLNIPIIILASLTDNMYRKPMLGLWDMFLKIMQNSINIDASFYCGDAGGCPMRDIKIIGTKNENYKITLKKDFSDTDLKFALNIGIMFIHRDEFVFGHKNNMIMPNYPLKLYNDNFMKLFFQTDAYPKFVPNHQEIVIMIGMPASGKSSYVKQYIINHGYVHINQDVLKTQKKCISMCIQNLENNKSIVIDNTNPNKSTRKVFIDIAKKYGVKCKCIYFNIDKDLAKHNNYFRSYINNINIIPDIVYNIYLKKFEYPEINEGFYKIEEIKFKFNNDINEKNTLYTKYYF